MRPQVSLSPHLEGVVRKRESFMVHAVSPLVLMVLYMYVIVVTTEFRYSRTPNATAIHTFIIEQSISRPHPLFLPLVALLNMSSDTLYNHNALLSHVSCNYIHYRLIRCLKIVCFSVILYFMFVTMC